MVVAWRPLTTRIRIVALATLVAALALLSSPVVAQTDEIQVYDGGIAEKGRFNLTWHDNYTPSGVAEPAFPGAVIADRSLNGVPEWAYGVRDWFEAGLYLPLYSIGKRDGARGTTAMLDGFKLRLLFVAPHADERRFFYGANFEFSVNARRWSSARVSSEVRPILGFRSHRFEVILNPILDTDYDGLANLDFAPATRIAYKWTKAWAVAVEEYDDFGPLRGFRPVREQSHQVYGVLNHEAKIVNIEAGVGLGLTRGSDRLTLKLILSRDLN
jgi:hypothetical protein